MGNCLSFNITHCCGTVACRSTFTCNSKRGAPPHRDCTGHATGQNRGRECRRGVLTPEPCVPVSGESYCIYCERTY
jgi:hypothetical protein